METVSSSPRVSTRALIRSFFIREASPITLGALWGVVTAALIHVLSFDTSFRKFLAGVFVPALNHFSDIPTYVRYVIVGLVLGVAFAALRYHSLLRRGVRSWRLGVTSGLYLFAILFTAACLTVRDFSFSFRIGSDLAAIAILFCVAAAFYVRAERAREHAPTEEDVRVSIEMTRTAGSATLESDDPIRTWAEDTIGRAAIVDTLSIRLLVSQSPVIALFGEFGSGKTSVLNLLREHLLGKAIIVSFNTWLPGSQQTLTSYLMADIASECQKHYVVPGLGGSTRRFANALSKSMPILSGLPELLPATTQRDDIEALRSALGRLPKRVVVLLDELDRMEKKEIRTLLKVVRGISSLPNLSFVCAAERNKLVEAMRGSTEKERNLYFEKFFPVSIPLPKLDGADLRRAGIERLVVSVRQRSWFASAPEEEEFRNQLRDLWEQRLAPFCGTLRAIGLLANDVGSAAAPLRREVDLVDLVFIEILRRFEPVIYDLVSRNGLALTGGEDIFRGGTYHSDEERKRLLDQFRKDIAATVQDEVRLNQIKAIIGELFPNFAKAENLSWMERPRRKEQAFGDKRISAPAMFPAYFRYELPKAIFSTVELEEFIAESRRAADEKECRELLRRILRSMEKGSLRRDDFLRKLADSVRTVDLRVARSWVFAALTLASDLTYDLFSAFGEAGHLIRMIIRLGERLPQSDRALFLSECIANSTDDTIPVRILTLLTEPRSDGYLGVSFAELYPAFIRRMRSRYGLEVDAATVDLRSADHRAFAIWGAEDLSKYGLTYDPQDRMIQYSFWQRYISDSRSRLIRVFNENLMPFMVYQTDPEEVVKRKADVAVLRKLFDELPDDAGIPEIPPTYITRMRRFLRGDFKAGIAPGEITEDDPVNENSHGK